jgi:hypothetical protein
LEIEEAEDVDQDFIREIQKEECWLHRHDHGGLKPDSLEAS